MEATAKQWGLAAAAAAAAAAVQTAAACLPRLNLLVELCGHHSLHVVDTVGDDDAVASCRAAADGLDFKELDDGLLCCIVVEHLDDGSGRECHRTVRARFLCQARETEGRMLSVPPAKAS